MQIVKRTTSRKEKVKNSKAIPNP